MGEEITRDIDGRSFEERVLAELAALRQEVRAVDARVASVEGRLTTLEDKVDARLRETRPIWEGMREQLDRVEVMLKVINTDNAARLIEMRPTDHAQLAMRVVRLEDRSPTA